MTAKLPLPTLLSQVLVAFTVEFDNESELQIAHWTTRRGVRPPSRGGVWLTSQVMWSNVMRLVEEEGITVGRLHELAHTTRDSLDGLKRWRYVTIEPVPGGNQRQTPRLEMVVRPTAGGRRAQEVWRPLGGLIEERWRARFGAGDIARLRDSLQALTARFEVALPHYLPVVYPTQNGRAEIPVSLPPGSVGTDGGAADHLDLSVLVSKVLLSFTIDFERASKISLPISANTLRVLDEAGVRISDLPRLTGVSKEANAMATGWLVRHGCAVIEPDPAASRGKVVRLTEKGLAAQAKYLRVLAATEQEWQAQYGKRDISRLRECLESLAGEDPGTRPSRLFEGLEPYPDGWRASVATPETLPHYPMVLHRGGFPDGS